MTIKSIIEDLVKLSPRFAQGEEATAKFINSFLRVHTIEFIDQEFETTVPVPKKAALFVNGEQLECRNVGRESGVFDTKNNIVSSLYWGDNDFYQPQNINFNPQCAGSVSMALYYKNPALAIKRSDVQKVIEAQEVNGETVVEPYTFTGHNFIVGNTTNPKSIIFTHYDCWESGAVDNASGTAVLLYMVVNNPELLNNNLFVIAGNEEISFDEPVYWGKGYRAFQDEYGELVEKAELLLCVDCVGYSHHEVITDETILPLGIPLHNLEKYISKTKMISGDLHRLFDFYHSNDDTPDLVTEEQLLDAQKQIIELL